MKKKSRNSLLWAVCFVAVSAGSYLLLFPPAFAREAGKLGNRRREAEALGFSFDFKSLTKVDGPNAYQELLMLNEIYHKEIMGRPFPTDIDKAVAFRKQRPEALKRLIELSRYEYCVGPPPFEVFVHINMAKPMLHLAEFEAESKNWSKAMTYFDAASRLHLMIFAPNRFPKGYLSFAIKHSAVRIALTNPDDPEALQLLEQSLKQFPMTPYRISDFARSGLESEIYLQALTFQNRVAVYMDAARGNHYGVSPPHISPLAANAYRSVLTASMILEGQFLQEFQSAPDSGRPEILERAKRETDRLARDFQEVAFLIPVFINSEQIASRLASDRMARAVHWWLAEHQAGRTPKSMPNHILPRDPMGGKPAQFRAVDGGFDLHFVGPGDSRNMKVAKIGQVDLANAIRFRPGKLKPKPISLPGGPSFAPPPAPIRVP